MRVRVDHILGKGQVSVERRMREKMIADGEMMDDLSMLGRVCKVERQVRLTVRWERQTGGRDRQVSETDR